MPFKIGERVKFLNEKGGGIVVDLKSDDLVEVLSDEGFNYILSTSDIVGQGSNKVNKKAIKDKLDGFNPSRVEKVMHQNTTRKHLLPDYLLNSKKNWTSKDRDFIEIDLHIEELVDKPSFLSDGEKLNFQLNHARMCLDEAYEFKVKRIIFIHGIGSGVLKNELKKWLESMGNLDVKSANYRRYGMGATEIWIKS